MGKNSKKPAIPPAAPQAKKEEELQVATENVMAAHVIKNYQGMSPDSAVTAFERIGKMVHDDPNACEHLNITPEQQATLNEFVLAGMTTLLIVDIAAKKSAYALHMSQEQLEVVQRVANEMGVVFTDKFLPTPDKNGNVSVVMSPSTVKVNKETEAAAKSEVATAESTVELDPTKFKDENDLAKALDYIIVSEKGAFLKFTRTASLLKSYRKIQAGENKEESEKIDKKSVGELLEEVFAVIAKCEEITHIPVIVNGFGKYIYRETSAAMSPVLAFCKLRDASKNSAGVPSVDANTLVGIQRTLVKFCAENGIKAEEQKIAEHKKNLDALSKNKEKNAEGIKDIENKIATCNANIEHFNDVIAVTHEPSSEFADDFLTDFADPNSENYKRARQAFRYIGESYYGADAVKTANQDFLKKNVQQYIGIITNMFRSAACQFDQYSEERLIALNEEPSKN